MADQDLASPVEGLGGSQIVVGAHAPDPTGRRKARARRAGSPGAGSSGRRKACARRART